MYEMADEFKRHEVDGMISLGILLATLGARYGGKKTFVLLMFVSISGLFTFVTGHHKENDPTRTQQ